MITLSNKPRPVPQPPPKISRPAPTAPAEPDRAPADLIRTRAYDLFLARLRLGIAGDDVTDWLQAERELSAPPHGPAPVEPKTQARGETLLRSVQD